MDRDLRITSVLDEILRRTIVFGREGRLGSAEELLGAVERIHPGSDGGSKPAILPPRGPMDDDSGGSAGGGSQPDRMDEQSPGVSGAFHAVMALLRKEKAEFLRVHFDQLKEEFVESWQHVFPAVKTLPSAAPDAGRQLIDLNGATTGATFAITRVDEHSLFAEWKQLLESMLQITQGEGGYEAVLQIPAIPAGFFYMAGCVSALHWRSWKILRKLLREKFAWYHRSGRALYSFGFDVSPLFHSEALGRNSARTHDLFREVLSQPEYAKVLGVRGEALIDLYIQAQMLQCLRAAQETEAGNEIRIWADFGRFYGERVVRLLDRVHHDSEYAEGFWTVFAEDPVTWKRKLNERLRFIRKSFFRGSSYFWDSIERDYEPR